MFETSVLKKRAENKVVIWQEITVCLIAKLEKYVRSGDYGLLLQFWRVGVFQIFFYGGHWSTNPDDLLIEKILKRG